MTFNKDLLVPCPIVTPTMEEFSDPIKYLSSEEVAKLGSEYGLIKVVPPKGWQPTFLISPEFKFHTRLQKLSDLGLTTRSRKFFTDNINRFMKMSRKRQLKLYFRVGLNDAKEFSPTRLKVYYYDLHVMVEKMGGYVNMNGEKWAQINDHFGLKKESTHIEDEYSINLRSYANFLSYNQKNYDFPESDSEDDYDNCLICGRHDNPSQTLLCDNCDNPFHLSCLEPALETVPSGSWYCDKCLIGTGEYGFEEQVDLKYSIPEFYQLCNEFEKKFEHEYNNDEPLSVDKIEQKFWEFIDVEKSDLEVRYGADIHNLKPGEISGFPMANTPGISPEDPETKYYMNHPWNLTKLPFAEGSLLNYINTSISGMTVPWIYIGSLLSTFCWHVEDHYTLSANYCHLGATKKWYGIPSYDADKFEKLMKDSAPDLFQKQPDLLHQLVTLLSPMTLVKNRIKCVYADQRPNEFVITYPRVYHAGFNCGFNFNEAVNFTMNSWLGFGEKSIGDYRLIKKENVFNHYQLVENILKKINTQDHINHTNLRLAEASLKCLLDFVQTQLKYISMIDISKFEVKLEPKLFKQRKFEDEQNGTFAATSEQEDEEDLCDVCRTHISFQYCIINNKSRNLFSTHGVTGESLAPPHAVPPVTLVKQELQDFPKIPIHQLLTPESSPHELLVPQATPKTVHSISDSSSATRLSALSETSITDTTSNPLPKLSEEQEFQNLIRAAKRSSSPDPTLGKAGKIDKTAPKRRKSSRIESLSKKAHLTSFATRTLRDPRRGKMSAVQNNSRFKHLNDKPQIRLCLACLVSSCHKSILSIPPGSVMLYEVDPTTMLQFISQTSRKIALLSTNV